MTSDGFSLFRTNYVVINHYDLDIWEENLNGEGAGEGGPLLRPLCA